MTDKTYIVDRNKFFDVKAKLDGSLFWREHSSGKVECMVICDEDRVVPLLMKMS